MNGRSIVSLAVMATLFAGYAEAAGRLVTDLSGAGWRLMEADGSSAEVTVPHSWNVEDGCDGRGVLSSERSAKNSSCANSYERKRVV